MVSANTVAEGVARAAATRLAEQAGVARYRNGRLEVDWLSRALLPRWRMVRLDGQWYERRALRDAVRGGASQVPATRRRLTAAEVADAVDDAPWSLSRYTARHSMGANPSMAPP